MSNAFKKREKRKEKGDGPWAERSGILPFSRGAALGDSFHDCVDLWPSNLGPHLFSLNESQRSRIAFRIVCPGMVERPAALQRVRLFTILPSLLPPLPLEQI